MPPASEPLERLLRALSVLGPHLENPPRRREIPGDLPLGPARALWAVAMSGPRPAVGEIARRLDQPLSRASRLLGELEQRGLIARDRDPTDRRRVVVTLAPAGRRLVQALRAQRLHRLRGLLDVIGRRDTEQLVRIFERAASRLAPAAKRRADRAPRAGASA